ncbi:MAG: cupredoxin domain-containing protein [Mycobacteriaceae bacterium]
MITIKDFKYQVPKSVKPGAKVTVMNMDRVVHSVTADTSTSVFDVDADPGVPASFTAPTKPGTYTFHCTYHGNMHGTLVVT